MRAKRYLSLLLAAALALALAGCGANEDKDKKQDGAMTIQPAQLSEEEEQLAELLALGMESHHIFEFQAADAKYLELNVYELVDGEWSHLSGGGGVGLSSGNGRIALTFGKMTEGVRLAIQEAGATYSASAQVEPGDDVSGMTFATSTLSGDTAIELEQEIPLVIQAVTSKNEVRMYQVDYFNMPRELAKSGYEHIYAITAAFSAQEIGGGSQPAPSTDVPSAEPSPES